MDLRGPGGRIDCLLPAWKAATLIDPTLSRTNALRTTCLEGLDLLIAEGKLVEILVENARFEAAARHVCRRTVGRTIDAIVTRATVCNT